MQARFAPITADGAALDFFGPLGVPLEMRQAEEARQAEAWRRWTGEADDETKVRFWRHFNRFFFFAKTNYVW